MSECVENVFDTIKKGFEDIGYKIYYKVLNIEEFGIPQLRRRVFIIGIKNNFVKEFTFPTTFKKKITLRYPHEQSRT